MKRIIVAGAKGGVGTTTMATTLAVLSAPHQRTRLNGVEHSDLLAILGLPNDGRDEVTIGGLTVGGIPDLEVDELLVYDAGVDGEWVPEDDDTTVLVVRNCYLALRRALSLPYRADRVVAVMEEHRALDERDIEDTLGQPVTAIPWDRGVARAVDAGLLGVRMPRTLRQALMSHPYEKIGA